MLINQNVNNWYVLMTQPRAAKLVGKRLAEIEFENFVPIQRQLRQWHDRKKWVEVPILNYYIFVYTNNKRRNKVFEVTGITKFLTVNGKLCTITDQEIERIKRLCSYNGKVEIQEGTIDVGDEVDIMEGHFIGLRGQVITTQSKTRIKISIQSLNCFATVEIEKSSIKKIIV
jgi:transcription antitermination factor NusG